CGGGGAAAFERGDRGVLLQQVAELVDAFQQAGPGERVQRELETTAVGQGEAARGDVDRKLDAGRVQQLVHHRLLQHDGQQAVLQRVAAEDVGDLAADDRAQAQVEQRPRRVLARGTAAEVAAGDQDLRALVSRAVERKVRVRRTIRQCAPVVERVPAQSLAL